MVTTERADRVAGAVFLIGLGIIALMDYWWPGLMFVAGAALIARGYVMGQSRQSIIGGLVVIGIGLLFPLQDLIGGVGLWPFLLIILGFALLFGRGGVRQE